MNRIDTTPDEDTEELIEDITPCNNQQTKVLKADKNAEYSFCDHRTSEVSSDEFRQDFSKSKHSDYIGPYIRLSEVAKL